MKTAYATIKGFEIMRMIRRRHCILIEPGAAGWAVSRSRIKELHHEAAYYAARPTFVVWIIYRICCGSAFTRS